MFAAALVDLDGIFQPVALLDIFQPGMADGGDMNEHVLAAVVRLDKSEMFAIAAEPFDDAGVFFGGSLGHALSSLNQKKPPSLAAVVG
jgi:hypothetical protein